MSISETEPNPAVPSAPAVEEPFAVSQQQTHVRVTLAGNPDLSAVERLHAVLLGLADGGQDIVIDCANAEHVSSAALQVLMAAEAVLAQKRQRLRIEAESAAVRDYLRLAGLDERFPGTKPIRGKRKKSSQVSPQP